MPTLFARRYTRRIEAVGGTERVLGVFILLLVAGIIATFVIQVATNEDYLFSVDESAYLSATTQPGGAGLEGVPSSRAPEEHPFPDAGLEDWRVPERIDRFTADNLHIKIDGRAEAYLKFGVVGLTIGSYRHESDGGRAIDVYWYEMGTPTNALGMYRAELAPGVASIAVGSEGYQVGGAVFFCESSAYVQVIPSRLDEADAGVALKIAERIADRLKVE